MLRPPITSGGVSENQQLLTSTPLFDGKTGSNPCLNGPLLKANPGRSRVTPAVVTSQAPRERVPERFRLASTEEAERFGAKHLGGAESGDTLIWVF